MNLNNLFFVVRTSDMKVTSVTDNPWDGDPNYICEEATPKQVSAACKADARLRIFRSK